MADVRYTYTAGMPAIRVGSLLARARLARQVSERDIARRVHVSARTVRDWERGNVVPTDDQIEAFARACAIPLVDLFPARGALSYDAQTGVMKLGEHSTILSTTARTNDDVLLAFLMLVRQQRRVKATQDVPVRTDDLDRTKPVIRELGFRLESSRSKGGKEYWLDKWVLNRGEPLEVEIQANLIHSRKIGSAIGLSFDELLEAGNGDPEAPIVLLIVAAVHGAVVHQFDRLQHNARAA